MPWVEISLKHPQSFIDLCKQNLVAGDPVIVDTGEGYASFWALARKKQICIHVRVDRQKADEYSAEIKELKKRFEQTKDRKKRKELRAEIDKLRKEWVESWEENIDHRFPALKGMVVFPPG